MPDKYDLPGVNALVVTHAKFLLATLSLRSFGNTDRAVTTRNSFDDLCLEGVVGSKDWVVPIGMRLNIIYISIIGAISIKGAETIDASIR